MDLVRKTNVYAQQIHKNILFIPFLLYTQGGEMTLIKLIFFLFILFCLFYFVLYSFFVLTDSCVIFITMWDTHLNLRVLDFLYLTSVHIPKASSCLRSTYDQQWSKTYTNDVLFKNWFISIFFLSSHSKSMLLYKVEIWIYHIKCFI